MSFYRGTVNSQEMNLYTHVNVLLPENSSPERTLLLLHGLSDNADAWVRRTGIGRMAEKYRLAVIMPEVQRSWYIDMAYGLPYFTYVFDELIPKMAAEFHIPADPEHLYVAGLSMGGYGAAKCAFTGPERFAGCMSFSARFYPELRMEQLGDRFETREWKAILGEDMKFQDKDLLEPLLKQALAAGKKIPAFYQACGTEDDLLSDNERMDRFLTENGVPHTCETWTGIHDWWFWDTAIQRGLAVMFPDE